MNDHFEDLLRAEFAGRAESAPTADGDGLADAAIAGAGRIRRRRLAAAAGGLAVVVLGVTGAVWLPWSGIGSTDPPGDTTVQEAQNELDIEFAVERESTYGVVNADDEYIPLSTEQPPTHVERLQGSYMVSSDRLVEVTSLDGRSSVAYELSADIFSTVVRGDAEAFAIEYFSADTGRTVHQLLPAYARSADPIVLDLSPELRLEDWNDDLLVFSSGLTDVSGGASGTYYFNAEHEWGLETVASAGYEAVVVTDDTDPDYVCVADLNPGTAFAESEECGYRTDDFIENMIATASGDDAAPGLVEKVGADFSEEEVETDIAGDPKIADRLRESDHQFTDPLGRWQIAFDSSDETWALLDTTGEEPVVTELRPPDGALMPVVSHN